jgi:hypothetical protein
MERKTMFDIRKFLHLPLELHLLEFLAGKRKFLLLAMTVTS